MAKWRVHPEEEPTKQAQALADQVERDGGTVLAVYREPVGDHWQIFCLLPMDKVEPTPYQRDLSPTHVKRLQEVVRKLDRFDVVLLDDIGYVQQDRDEMEVLFTFLAERYERKSVLITSNLVFSQWDRIFRDPMTTAAAIDRLVHHATILEFAGPSIRDEEAKKRNSAGTGASAEKTTSKEEKGS